MSKHSTIITIERGQIVHRDRMKAFIQSLPDGRYYVLVDSDKKRTGPQNRFLHAVLIPEFRKALVSVGYPIASNDQAKQIMKAMFLTENVANEQTVEVLSFTRDTHTLTTVEMGTLIDEVVRFAAENMNYVIPLPNEQLMLNW